mmetsp:Transcript_24463/g.27320  ORF Transcript_24463/g.27320 Transcript_24463/m.27320 type:complete len:293 (+) Transcript_24463:72-950(+)
MTRLLYYVTSFVGICFFTTLSLPGVASEADVAVTVTDEKKTASALELGYGVLAYECDTQMQELAEEDKVTKIEATIYTKIVGTVIRICFVPNQAALDAGIGLKEINNFKWETINKRGDDLRRDAITNGKGDGVLSAVTCRKDAHNTNDDPITLEGNSVCLMESMLGSTFYIDTASVMGSGEATLTTKNDGTVPVNVDIFQLGFSIKFRNGPDGAELSNEETKELLQSIDEHNAAIASNSTSSGEGEDDAAAAAIAESSSGEDEKDDNDTMSVSSIDDTQNENRKEDEGKDEL